MNRDLKMLVHFRLFCVCVWWGVQVIQRETTFMTSCLLPSMKGHSKARMFFGEPFLSFRRPNPRKGRRRENKRIASCLSIPIHMPIDRGANAVTHFLSYTILQSR